MAFRITGCEKPFQPSGISSACTSGTRAEHPRRMLKKADQQGRSERRAEAYPLGYVEGLNDARTKLADFFSILLYPFDPNGRYIHDTPQHRGIPENAADHIDTVGRDRILPHTHRRASEENGQDLPCTPESDIADFDVIRRRLSMVLHPGHGTVELFTPCVDRTFNRQGGINFLRRLRRLEL